MQLRLSEGKGLGASHPKTEGAGMRLRPQGGERVPSAESDLESSMVRAGTFKHLEYRTLNQQLRKQKLRGGMPEGKQQVHTRVQLVPFTS